MKQQIAVLGSTGSIGTNTLDVIRRMGNGYRVHALAVRKNLDLLEEQIHEFKPKIVCVWEKDAALQLSGRRKSLGVKVFAGEEGLLELVRDKSVDIFSFGLSGSESVAPLLEALKLGKRVTIANKEPLVMAGSLIRKTIQKYRSEILPVDSEHSAIFQSLRGHGSDEIEKLLLTASGGPFFRMPLKQFSKITPAMALKHPRWKMGKKITVDSATMMNKSLEIIEAATLFGVPSEKIDVLIHPSAIIHSMVQFVDGSVIAQLGVTDMRLPIQYALTYPRRVQNSLGRVDFNTIDSLEFYKPDLKKFPALRLGTWAAKEGGTLPAVLNAADEITVDMFLKGKISFPKIVSIIENTLCRHRKIQDPSYEEIVEADRWAREEARKLCLQFSIR